MACTQRTRLEAECRNVGQWRGGGRLRYVHSTLSKLPRHLQFRLEAIRIRMGNKKTMESTGRLGRGESIRPRRLLLRKGKALFRRLTYSSPSPLWSSFPYCSPDCNHFAP
jgi:hypothetical protein